METTQKAKTGIKKNWIKKFSVAGFIFFLLKGIAWIVFGYFVIK